jgi:hypothetical protein
MDQPQIGAGDNLITKIAAAKAPIGKVNVGKI